MDVPIMENWKITAGGSRAGACVTVTGPSSSADIYGDVMGWLDAEGNPTARKNAFYVLIRRWSYGGFGGDPVPDWFSVPIATPSKYNSKTFKPAE